MSDENEQIEAVEAFFEELDAQDEPTEDPVEAPEPVEEPELDEDPSAAVSTDEGHSEGDEPEEDDEDEQSEEEELHPAELRRREQQAFYDQKVVALEQRLSNLDQWAQNVYQQQLAQHQQQVAAQQQAQPSNPLARVTKDEVVQAVGQDLVGTFQAVVQHRPDLVATTIATAREQYGNEIGDQMQLDYSQYLAQQERQAREQQYNAQRQAQAEADAPAQIQATMVEMIDGIAAQHGEAFAEIQDDFIAHARNTAPAFREYMVNQGLQITPDSLNYFLNKCVQDVREQRISVQAAKPRRARKVSPAEHAEGSTSSQGNRVEDMTADQRAISELLEGAKELSIDISAPNR